MGELANPEMPHHIFVRRYTPDSRPWCPFHYDISCCTVNVALTDDKSHKGGRLIAVYDGAIHAIERSEGCATVHPSSLLHAVSRMQCGSRYSLILFSGQVCPHSDHRLESIGAAQLRTRYPEDRGGYHCDGCGDGYEVLGDSSMYHCQTGCDYALCVKCAHELLDFSTWVHLRDSCIRKPVAMVATGQDLQ